MCGHCGCPSEKALLSEPGTKNHHHLHADTHTLQLQQSLLSGNDSLAEQNQQWLAERNITCINLMGTPGAGKTQLLEKTFSELSAEALPEMAVLEGDQQTLNDAKRIQAKGGKAIQINTGTGCHLDAEMVKVGLENLLPTTGSIVFIENVGNLVCPALFNLGEQHRVAMMAVTDGDDKPEKYPHLFSSCELIIINKADLLAYLDFDLEKAKQAIHRLNPHAHILLLSAKTNQGLSQWQYWLQARKTRPMVKASCD